MSGRARPRAGAARAEGEAEGARVRVLGGELVSRV